MKYPDVLNLPDKTAHAVIQKIKSVFARQGILKELMGYHIPFSSDEMRKSNLRYHQSSGPAGQTIKM